MTALERFYSARRKMEHAACFAILDAGEDADKMCSLLAAQMGVAPGWLAGLARVTIPRKYLTGFQLTTGQTP